MFKQLETSPAGISVANNAVLSALPFNEDSLTAVVAQQFGRGEVLMLAWMNRATLIEALTTGPACFWPRSSQSLGRKGETSVCTQVIKEMRLDCDDDTLLLPVGQTGPACHTGRRSCFSQRLYKGRLLVLSAPSPHG